MALNFKSLLSFAYPPLCCHCQRLMPDHTKSLCALCSEEIVLEPLDGRCSMCFTRLESPRCSICSKRATRIARQLAAVEELGPALTLLRCAQRGDHTVLPAIAALLAYQWLRHQMPIPDVVIAGDCPIALAEQVARLLGSRAERPLVKRWDCELFMTTGHIAPRYVLRRCVKTRLVDQSVLIVSLKLDDTLLQLAARALEPAFPSQIYALAFAAAPD